MVFNFKHLWQLIQDAWHADKIIDKIIIWFMPTGWRPKNVELEYPIHVIGDPKKQNKYCTKSSTFLLIWTWMQLLVTFFLMFHLFIVMENIGNIMIVLYAILILSNVFSFSSLLDGKNYAIIGEIIKIGIIIYVVTIYGYNWYGLRGIYYFIFITYFSLSALLSYFFLTKIDTQRLKA